MEQQFTAEQRLERTHVQMMEINDLKFFGALCLYGGNDIGTDKTQTAATDGINTYYNPDFVQEMTDKELMFVVLHEQMHKAHKHLIVWKHLVKEDALLANMAMDYVINLQLVDLQEKTNGRYFTMPVFKEGKHEGKPHGLVDEAYRDMNVQQVFDILKQKNKQSPQPPTNEGGKPCEDGEGCEEYEDDPENFSAGGKGSNNSEEGEEEEEGHGSGGYPLYSDEIKELEEQMGDDHNWGSGEEEKSAEELEEIAEELDRAVRQAAQVAGDSAGEFAATIRELIEVETSWEELLAEFIQSTCKGDDLSTFQRFNRRLLGSGVYAPSTIGEAIGSIVVAVDTSASISQKDIDRFLSEVRVIVEDVVPEKVHLLYWDTKVAEHEIYDEDDYECLTETTKPKGGGGTDPVCVVEYVKDNISLDNDVECMLILTDAYVGQLREAIWDGLDYPVLWVVCPNGAKGFNPRIGQVINLD